MGGREGELERRLVGPVVALTTPVRDESKAGARTGLPGKLGSAGEADLGDGMSSQRVVRDVPEGELFCILSRTIRMAKV